MAHLEIPQPRISARHWLHLNAMHPFISVFGLFRLPTYGLFVATGIVAGTWLASHLARKVKLPEGFALDAVFYVVLSGLLGARLTYMLVEWRATLQNPLAALLNSGGMVFLGGFFCATIALYLYCRKHRLAFGLAADVFAPAVALGHFFGRIGCLLAGCCYGAPAHGISRLIAICYPRLTNPDGTLAGSWPFLDHLEQGLVGPMDACSLPVYPTPLIEAGFNLALCGWLLWLWRWRKFDGQIALIYVATYSFARFWIEFLRGDAVRGFYGPLSTSQWLSIACIAVATVIYVHLLRAKRRDSASSPTSTI